MTLDWPAARSPTLRCLPARERTKSEEETSMSTLNSDQFARIRTLGDIARVHATVRPDAVAMKFEGRTTTYRELDAHTNRVAHALLAAGISKDGRIGYLAKNTDCFFEILIGGAKCGAVTLPIGWRLAAAEIAYLLENGEVSLLFVGREFVALARQAIEISGQKVRVIELESDAPDGYTAWRDSGNDVDPAIAISPSGTALQLYTSGTTGRPKGVMLPPTMFAAGATIAEHIEKLAQSPFATVGGPHLIVGPLYHTGPLSGSRSIAGGTALVI
ncbi:MAG TPA: hypothetical protein DCL54_03490, partial [Alphaproteobacteria bacterium]|nr:hypothetical protein [Alphaproteobacteria bacterium]